MAEAQIQIPKDNESLKKLALKQAHKIVDLERMIQLQAAQIRLILIKKYGCKSEKLSDNQLLLLEGEPGITQQEVEQEAQEMSPVKTRKKRNPNPGRIQLPEHLERVEEIIPCPKDQCQCPQCGKETKVFDYEISEVLDLKPVEYFVKVIKREKRACPDCPEQGVQCAPPLKRIVDKGKFSDDFIIDTLLKKYRLHQPLFRQSVNLVEDFNLDISRSTLCVNLIKVGELCAPLSGAMRPELFEGGYIQADETPIWVQSPRKKGKNHQAYLFEYSRPDGPVIFDFSLGRSREGPEVMLKGFEGILQTDGYSAYLKFSTDKITRVGCMAHIRRKFDEAYKAEKKHPLALEVLGMIRELYAVEKQAREKELSHEQRLKLRQSQSAPVMEKLKARITEIRLKPTVLPKSQLGKACNYALGQWEAIKHYLNNGHVEIDNNSCERSIRPVAIGRKNWIHIGSENAGPKIAGIISIVETCLKLEIRPRDYLKEILPEVAERLKTGRQELSDLTPMAWKANQTTTA
ncbi:MAG: IS66 family transposase [Opitutae bacterium]|nr:IS66 family transposase [Opitutae bacterium]